MPFSFPVTMRAAPTISATTAQTKYYDTGGTQQTVTSIVAVNGEVTGGNIIPSTTGILTLKQSTGGSIGGGASAAAEL